MIRVASVPSGLWNSFVVKKDRRCACFSETFDELFGFDPVIDRSARDADALRVAVVDGFKRAQVNAGA
jgi:hypothetical protein